MYVCICFCTWWGQFLTIFSKQFFARKKEQLIFAILDFLQLMPCNDGIFLCATHCHYHEWEPNIERQCRVTNAKPNLLNLFIHLKHQHKPVTVEVQLSSNNCQVNFYWLNAAIICDIFYFVNIIQHYNMVICWTRVSFRVYPAAHHLSAGYGLQLPAAIGNVWIDNFFEWPYSGKQKTKLKVDLQFISKHGDRFYVRICFRIANRSLSCLATEANVDIAAAAHLFRILRSTVKQTDASFRAMGHCHFLTLSKRNTSYMIKFKMKARWL